MYVHTRDAPQVFVVCGRGHADDPPGLPDLGGELGCEVADAACIGGVSGQLIQMTSGSDYMHFSISSQYASKART